MTRVLLYIFASLGGIVAGVGLTTLIVGSLVGSFSALGLILLVVGLAIAAVSVPLGGRPMKSLGLTLGGMGGATVAVSVVQMLIALSRGDVTFMPVVIELVGTLLLLIGFAMFSKGREGSRPLALGGGLLFLVGLGVMVWGVIQDPGALIVVALTAGVLAYLYGLFLSQLDDDKREVEAAFRLLEDQAAEGVAREHAAVNKRTFSKWFGELGLLHVVAILAVVYSAFPIVYVVSASFNPGGTLTGSNELFANFSAENYQELAKTRWFEWLGNSLQISIITAIITVLMGAAAAYAFSRYRFSGRKFSLIGLLIIQMFPQILAFVAIFLLLQTLGYVWPPLGIDSKWALIAVYLGGALGANTFLMYGFFNTVPKELDEAAKIDGATHTQIYWTIILRLVAPILAVVALLSFISSFNEFIIARLVLPGEENWTLAVGMYQWVSDLMNQNWGIFAAGSVLGAIPILILFLALQKYIVGGLTAGSVKG